MRRAFPILAISAAAGFILNLAVAYVCARLAPLPSPGLAVAGLVAAGLPLAGLSVGGGGGPYRVYAQVQSGVGCDYYLLEVESQAGEDMFRTLAAGARCEAGWPMRSCLVVMDAADLLMTPTPRDAFWETGGFLPERLRDVTVCRPLAGGTLVNTVLYGCLASLVLVYWQSRRREDRRRRGLCPLCAYPAGASAVCTECGGPVRPAQEIQL